MTTRDLSHVAKPRRVVLLWLGSWPAPCRRAFWCGPCWRDWNGGFGLLLLLPVTALVLVAWFGGQMRPLRWWAGLLAMLYDVQVVPITAGQSSGSDIRQALHPFKRRADTCGVAGSAGQGGAQPGTDGEDLRRAGRGCGLRYALGVQVEPARDVVRRHRAGEIIALRVAAAEHA